MATKTMMTEADVARLDLGMEVYDHYHERDGRVRSTWTYPSEGKPCIFIIEWEDGSDSHIHATELLDRSHAITITD